MKTRSAILVGVGGQGAILTAKVFVNGLMKAGYDVKMSEVHGMSQRGGSVSTQVHWGDKVYSPVIGDGAADLMVAFEKMEAVRYARFLKPDGVAVINDYAMPSSTVAAGLEVYPEGCLEAMEASFKCFTLDAEQIGDSILRLTIVAQDGENGFPGKVTATTIYKVCSDNMLDITWEAETDKPTIINQTNHNYYNLSGDFTQPGYDQVLYVNADSFTASDAKYIPTGEIRSVEGTPFDFRTPHAIGDSIQSQYDQIQNATGYDHNFCLNTFKDGKGDDTQVCASLYSPKTGIFMEMFTNEPGVQVYSGNFQGVGKDADIVRKLGLKYPKHVSVCLESQKYPDSPNHPEWVSPVLNPGEKYYSRAAYKFSIK